MVVAMVGGVALALGVESSGTGQSALPRNQPTTPAQQHETEARSRTSPRTAAEPHAAPTVDADCSGHAHLVKHLFNRRAPQPPSRYAQWAEEKYMKALESPQMVHGVPQWRNAGNRQRK